MTISPGSPVPYGGRTLQLVAPAVAAGQALSPRQAQRYFVGADRVSLADTLLKGTPGQAHIITTVRRNGKTTLLNRLLGAGSGSIRIFIAGSRFGASASADELHQAIAASLRAERRRPSEPSTNTDRLAPLRRPRQIAPALYTWHYLRDVSTETPVIVCLDEISMLFRTDPHFFHRWRSECSDRGARVALVMPEFFETLALHAHDRALAHAHGGIHSSSLNNAQRRYMPPLDAPAVAAMATQRLFGESCALPGGVTDFLMLLGGGNAFLHAELIDTLRNGWIRQTPQTPSQEAFCASDADVRMLGQQYAAFVQDFIRNHHAKIIEPFTTSLADNRTTPLDVLVALGTAVWATPDNCLDERRAVAGVRTVLGLDHTQDWWVVPTVHMAIDGAHFFLRRYGTDGDASLRLANLGFAWLLNNNRSDGLSYRACVERVLQAREATA